MKPRTQDELDAQFLAFYGDLDNGHVEAWHMKNSMELSAYVDAGVQRERNKFTPRYLSEEGDDIHHNDRKHAETFPAAEYTIFRGGKVK